MIQINKEWVLDNLLSELIFGVILLGIIGFLWRYARDAYKAIKIFKILSTHNNASRTRRKGIYAMDRFMIVFEAGRELTSAREAVWGMGEGGGVWSEEYIDKGIIAHHGLATITQNNGRQQITAKEDRLTRWVYKLCKWYESWEQKRTVRFITDESGKLRERPRRN